MNDFERAILAQLNARMGTIEKRLATIAYLLGILTAVTGATRVF